MTLILCIVVVALVVISVYTRLVLGFLLLILVPPGAIAIAWGLVHLLIWATISISTLLIVLVSLISTVLVLILTSSIPIEVVLCFQIMLS